MIERTHYIEQIRGFYDTDLIKIITGVRRSGKSVILEQIMSEIKRDSKNVLYLNFEDERIRSNIPDCRKLLEYIDSQRKPGKNYLFFDEIQEVKDWQLACKTLRLGDNSVFITGSNSKLLSKEYTKEFSGRYVAFQVRPFVFKEIVAYSKELGFSPSVSDYLVWGGFPKRFEFENSEDQSKYLSDLNQSIVEHDVINRYNIQNTELFRRVTNFVLKTNSRIFSSRSIEGYLKNEHVEGSINTIIKYLNYLEEAYIIERIKPYSAKTKTELSYYFKIYDADVSFNSIRHIDKQYDLTHNLENIVYNELIYMGYKVSVYNNIDGKEIDFFVQKDGKDYYIQVAYSVVEKETYEREFGAFARIDNSAQKILITNDDLDYSTSTVKHLRLPDFLQLDSLDDIN
ncbi:ATP-binding protein [Candidatus Saccharibacteria bacterium]|nr:ATP-binding protein [Candidatus Saccharibacteria bacterium]